MIKSCGDRTIHLLCMSGRSERFPGEPVVVYILRRIIERIIPFRGQGTKDIAAASRRRAPKPFR